MKNTLIISLFLLLLSCSSPDQRIVQDQLELNTVLISKAKSDLLNRLQYLGMPTLGQELLAHIDQIQKVYDASVPETWQEDKEMLISIIKSNPIPDNTSNQNLLRLLDSKNQNKDQHQLIFGNWLLNYLMESELQFIDLYGLYDRAEVRIDKIGSSQNDLSLEVLLENSMSTLNPIIELIDGNGNSVPIDVDKESVGRIKIRRSPNLSEVTFRITTLTLKGEVVREKTVKVSDL